MIHPEPGDRVQVGNLKRLWTLSEVVRRHPRYEVANLYDPISGDTKIHVPLHELFVVHEMKEAA